MKKLLALLFILVSVNCFADQGYGNNTLSVDSSGGINCDAGSNYRRYHHASLFSSSPGASGATFTDADGNTIGGWQLNAAGELLRFQFDIHSDWDGASDMKAHIHFDTNADNGGGAGGDTVDVKMVFYYKGTGDIVTKTQTVEVATVIGTVAQYTNFSVAFTFDWDASSNVIEAGDHITGVMNLETDTSEVDDIIVTDISFQYNKTNVGIESGDVD